MANSKHPSPANPKRSPGTIGRIACDSGVLSGKPCIAGTRISVELVLEELAAGTTIDDLLQAYPHVRRRDIQAVLAYALSTIRREEVAVLPGAVG